MEPLGTGLPRSRKASAAARVGHERQSTAPHRQVTARNAGWLPAVSMLAMQCLLSDRDTLSGLPTRVKQGHAVARSMVKGLP
jgi:hypothetical protein